MAVSSEPVASAGWPLRRLVTLWAAGAGLALIAIFTFGALRSAEQAAWRRAEAQAATELAGLTVVAERLAVDDRTVVTELLMHSTLDHAITVALLLDPGHRVRSSSRATDHDHLLADLYPAWVDLIQQTAQSDATMTWSDLERRQLVTARGIVWPAMPGELRSQRRGALLVVTDVGHSIDETRHEALRAQAGQAAVLLLAGAGLLMTLDRLIRRPLTRLRDVAQQIGDGRFGDPIPPSGIRELRALGGALNRMSADLQANLERLGESEQRYRDMTSSAPDAIVMADLNGRISEFNQAAERLFGYSAAEAAGQSLDLLLPDGLKAAHAHHLAAFAQAQEPAARRMNAGRLVAGRHRSGRPLHLEIGISRSRIGGQLNFTAMIRDVSDRIAIEAELEAHRRELEDLVRQRTAELVLERDRAQGATRAKSEFLANMGHELRTPLNAIIGLAHLATRQSASTGSAHLEEIESSARSLLAVINDVLDFSRLEAGHIALLEADASVWGMLHAVCEPLATTAAAQGVALLERVEPGVPGMLKLDEFRLRQVLGHLVGNAVKFTSSGHVLLHVRPGPAPQTLRFEVSDTGIGITPEVLQRLFAPFEQGDSSDARRFGGAGIGLVISQRLLRLMGGTLQARSVAGAGSTFWFDLPVRPASEPAAPLAGPETSATRADPARPAAWRVLVVDASAAAGEASRSALQALGHDVDLVTSPDAVLQTLQALRDAESAQAPYDLCVVDAALQTGDVRELGDCDAFELGRQIDEAGLAHPPRRVLTAMRNAPLALATVLRQRYLGLLSKPLEPDALAQRLATWWHPIHTLQVPAKPARAGLDGAEPPGIAPGTEAELAPDAHHLRWSGITGLDAGSALRSLRDDPLAYQAQVQRFLELHRRDAARLRQLAARASTGETASLAHALESSAAAIGAHAVAASAGVLALQADALAPGLPQAAEGDAQGEIRARSRALADELGVLVDALQDTLGSVGGPAGWAADDPRSRHGAASESAGSPADARHAGTPADTDLRRALIDLLQRRDMSALRLVRDRPQEVRALFGPVAPTLLAAIADFDFDAAIGLLRAHGTSDVEQRS